MNKFKKKNNNNFSSIKINSKFKNDPLIKEFNFNYIFNDDLIFDFQPKENIFCYFFKFSEHKNNPTYISSKLNSINIYNNNNKINAFILYLIDFSLNLNEIENKILDELDILNENIFEVKNNNYSNLNENEINQIENLLIKLNLISEENNIPLLIGFSNSEIVDYIYTLSTLDIKNNNFRQKNIQKNSINKQIYLNEIICSIDDINKNDATKLFGKFNSIKEICNGILNEDNNNILIENKINNIKEFFLFDFEKLKIN
jgi:hypothetical protein